MAEPIRNVPWTVLTDWNVSVIAWDVSPSARLLAAVVAPGYPLGGPKSLRVIDLASARVVFEQSCEDVHLYWLDDARLVTAPNVAERFAVSVREVDRDGPSREVWAPVVGARVRGVSMERTADRAHSAWILQGDNGGIHWHAGAWVLDAAADRASADAIAAWEAKLPYHHGPSGGPRVARTSTRLEPRSGAWLHHHQPSYDDVPRVVVLDARTREVASHGTLGVVKHGSEYSVPRWTGPGLLFTREAYYEDGRLPGTRLALYSLAERRRVHELAARTNERYAEDFQALLSLETAIETDDPRVAYGWATVRIVEREVSAWLTRLDAPDLAPTRVAPWPAPPCSIAWVRGGVLAAVENGAGGPGTLLFRAAPDAGALTPIAPPVSPHAQPSKMALTVSGPWLLASWAAGGMVPHLAYAPLGAVVAG